MRQNCGTAAPNALHNRPDSRAGSSETTADNGYRVRVDAGVRRWDKADSQERRMPRAMKGAAGIAGTASAIPRTGRPYGAYFVSGKR